MREEEHGIWAKIQNYEDIREHLFLQPVNYLINRAELKNFVYERHSDLALVLCAQTDGRGAIRIPDFLFERWGKKQGELWAEVLENTSRLLPPCIFQTGADAGVIREQENLMDTGGWVSWPGKSADPEADPTQWLTVTTTQWQGGAAAVFYTGMCERLARLAGGDYYVLFVGSREARVYRPTDADPGRLRKILLRENRRLRSEPALSRNVFYYAKETSNLKVVH